MHQIDMQYSPRSRHFRFFNHFDHPHFGLCANVDVTRFLKVVKGGSYSVTLSLVYVLTRGANDIPEFRQRIRGEQVIEHEVIHPSITVLGEGDRFGFCLLDYQADFHDFVANNTGKMLAAKEELSLENPVGRDDLLFMTALPWVSFTSFMHPIHLQPPDSIPRFAWGKFFPEGPSWKMPLGVQGHHALMDGIHMGKYYASVQAYLDQPTAWI